MGRKSISTVLLLLGATATAQLVLLLASLGSANPQGQNFLSTWYGLTLGIFMASLSLGLSLLAWNSLRQANPPAAQKNTAPPTESLKDDAEFKKRISQMVHDVNNPLHLISMSTELLAEIEKLSPDGQALSAKILTSCERASSILTDFKKSVKASPSGAEAGAHSQSQSQKSA